MTVRNYALACALLGVTSGCEQPIDAPASDASETRVEMGHNAHSNADDMIDKAPHRY